MLVLGLAMPASAETAEEEGAEAKDSYIEFEPLSVTIVQNQRVSGILTISFMLATTDPLLVEEIETLRPKVRSEVHQTLARLAATRLSPSQPLNMKLVIRFMQSAVDQIFGEHKIDVLIQLASIRPL